MPRNFDWLTSLLEEVDRMMERDGIPIQDRPMEACRRLATEQKAWLSIGGDAWNYLTEWLSDRYGGRLTPPTLRGQSMVMGRTDCYRVKLPIIYGRIAFKPLEFIEGIPAHVASNLTAEEWSKLAHQVASAIDAFQLLHNLPEGCTEDIPAAVS